MGTLNFDKDVDTMVAFIHSAANIRASLFGIETGSMFDVKQMAGAIVPAVATTNSMVASLAVLQALAVLENGFPEEVNDQSAPSRGLVKQVFVAYKLLGKWSQNVKVSKNPERAKTVGHCLISSFEPPKPNPNCSVCSEGKLRLKINASTTTVGLIRLIIENELKLKEAEASTLSGMIFISPDFDEVDDNRLIKDMNIGDGSSILVNGSIHLNSDECNGDSNDDQFKSMEIIVFHDELLKNGNVVLDSYDGVEDIFAILARVTQTMFKEAKSIYILFLLVTFRGFSYVGRTGRRDL
ncbi:hypothetical protein ACOME3_001652 [Neoechinorhynchus agilis]